MEIDARLSPFISINAPDWFQERDFLDWLNGESRLMTWHKKGERPNDFSDTLVFVDPSLSGEGSEQGEMPDQYWEKIVSICRDNFSKSTGFHIVVRLTNLNYE